MTEESICRPGKRLTPERGNLSVAATPLTAKLQGQGRSYPLPELRLVPGANRLELLPERLAPGEYRLELYWGDWFRSIPVRILPSPWQ